jgi:cephalosporin hydroxylase
VGGLAIPSRATGQPDEIRDEFHRLYYRAPRTWRDTYWLGVPVLKSPLDLWIYQELLYELAPDVIVETGTRHGGSAFFFASVCDLLGRGRVVTIDVEELQGRPAHPRLVYLAGSSADPAVAAQVEEAGTVRVILDSDHSREHVLAELELWAPRVTLGSYLVVEDTNVNGHPVFSGHGPGPWEAWPSGCPPIRSFGATRHGRSICSRSTRAGSCSEPASSDPRPPSNRGRSPGPEDACRRRGHGAAPERGRGPLRAGPFTVLDPQAAGGENPQRCPRT